MPEAHRRADIGSAHSCHFPPTPATGGSPDVYVNDRPLMRIGDAYVPHGCPACPQPAHSRKLAAGSASVFINGKPAGRISDAIDCGGQAQTGSSNVFIGDKGLGAAGGNGASGGTSCQASMAAQSMPTVRG
ncbi:MULTISPECIES: PAAR domain-containing protein [Neorhizobium]|uniref:PAAR domain-containing protein n=1 Tax=Neorhizobium sp. T6_25 TaxID=2093833 RepID=UPI000CF9B53F|nr:MULTISPECIES: PAAR domain-containing protein [Neorhizobium]